MTTSHPEEIVFATVPSLTTCSQAAIGWTWIWIRPSIPIYPLVVTNSGIDQGGLIPGGTTAVNVTLGAINPSVGKFDWSKVNVPQGRYRLDVQASLEVLSSNVFTVTNGVDTSCLVVSTQSSIPPSSTLPSSTPPGISTPTPSSSPSTSSTSSPSVTPQTDVSGNSSVNKGLIAGSIIGGVAVLLLIAVIALWGFRRRKTIVRSAVPPGSKTKGGAPRGVHNPSDSTGTILPFGGGNRANSPQLSASEEDLDFEKSAISYDDIRPTPPPIAATKSYPKPRPVSITAQPSFESHEAVQPKTSRQPHGSLDSVVPPNETVVPPDPVSPSHTRHPSDRTRRASRKPVPVYDLNEFPGSETNDIPLADRSETSLGGGARTYYIIPDAPLEQRK